MRDRQADTTQREVDRAAATVRGLVQAALDEVADRFAREVLHAEPVTAAGVDPTELDRLVDLWVEQLPPIITALAAVYHTSVEAVVRRFASQALLDPDHPVARRVADLADAYLTTAQNRLVQVGDSLWQAARDELAAGSRVGESIDQITDRLRRAFAVDGQELGVVRAERIARTETAMAWNTASFDTTRALPDEVRPGCKVWLSAKDQRVRDVHAAAHGQTVPLDGKFNVGGELLDYPCDPNGSPTNVINCRCVAVYEPCITGDTGTLPISAAGRGPGHPTRGVTRSMSLADLVAAARSHTGAMIALVPTVEHANRLAVDGGEPADVLHLTLAYLGDADQWTVEQRQALVDALTDHDWDLPDGVAANAFGAAHWNPDGEHPAWVLNVGGDQLSDVHAAVWNLLAGVDGIPGLPAQHLPWSAHLCITYDPNPRLIEEMEARLGPIEFDRLRVAFADQNHDIPLTRTVTASATPSVRTWSTPKPYALVFEDTQTGDGRVFTPGALRWEGDSWPLMYTPQMLSGHDGAQLCGEIQVLVRSGTRIASAGGLYTDTNPGREVADQLDRGAPLGVSADLDDVTFELVETSGGSGDGEVVASHISTHHVDRVGVMHTGDGLVLRVPQVAAATLATRQVVANAGDPDPDGNVLITVPADEVVFRITDARVRGATLVPLPAFADARIVLDPVDGEGAIPPIAAVDGNGGLPPVGELMAEIIDFVVSADKPVRPGQVAEALGIPGNQARTYLSRAYTSGRLARPARGLYTRVAPTTTATSDTTVVAATAGDVLLPIHPERERAWDGQAAASRVLDWANGQAADSDQPPGVFLARAFLYRDPDANPNTLAAYRLGFADVIDGELRIVARGVFTAAGGRGVDAADIPEPEREEIRGRICALYQRLADEFDEDLVCPWDRDDPAAADVVTAAAWAEFDALPPLPARWFAEPTEEELPPDSGGLHITDDGRIYGWVAQRGVPHEGYPGRNLTIDDLEPVDTSWFLRKRFRLDDGSEIPLGPFVMNVGHHRDGGNCETQACLWDDSRTIAGLITVGFNERGMWFSGAAAPWLSQWDLAAFAVCQPSYHMVAKPEGGYKLGAVLAVPRPGHPSRLVASVAARAKLALTPNVNHHGRDGGVLGVDVDTLVTLLASAVVDEQERRRREREQREIERAALVAQMQQLDG